MWNTLKKIYVATLESSVEIHTMEIRLKLVEQKLEVLQAKVAVTDANVALILGHPALTEFEVEMTRLEKIFSSGAERFLPSSWYWLQKCPNECLQLANS